ncbi:MAG: glycosyltransferase [Candidatus Omnitrophica bacterium]|nr:glycosyltransferase [Candidatus Omnitrophota bacterium]
MIRLVCPQCKKPVDPERGFCPACNVIYTRRRGVLDLRPEALLKKAKDWRLDIFESTYEAMGFYRDHMEALRKKGYDEDFTAYVYPKVKGGLIDLIPKKEDVSILDVGCGVGFYLFQLERQGGFKNSYFAGIDAALPNIVFFNQRIAEEHRDNFLAVLGMAECLPFESNSFDTVTCSEALEHIEDKGRALTEAFRVLKTGGSLFITTPSRFAVGLWKSVFFVPIMLTRLLRREPLDKEKAAAYDKPLFAWQLKRLLEKNGFEVARFERNVYLPHESYFPHFPAFLKKFTLKAASFVEDAPILRDIFSFLGLHFVVECRKLPPKLKLLYLVDDLKIGGTENFLVDALPMVCQRGAEAFVITLFEGGELEDDLRKKGIYVECLRLKKTNVLSAIVKLAYFIKKNNINAIHTFRIVSDILGAFIGRACGVNKIICTKGSLSFWKNGFYKFLDRAAVRLATKVIAVSEAVRRDIVDNYKVADEKLVVVYNGVNLNKFEVKADSPRLLKDLGIDPESKRIGCIANLNPRKGHKYLLDAFPLVLKDVPDSVLILVGDGELREELEGQAGRLNIKDRVVFLGKRKKAFNLMGIFNCLVLPSITEGLAITLLEAMASGVPIIGTAVGGIPEVIINGETGLLVPPKDKKALAEAIVVLLRDKPLAQRLASEARARVKDIFSLEDTVKGYLRTYGVTDQ